MIDYTADRADAARSRTRIRTAFIDARLLWQTFGAERTLGPTIGRPADIVGQTRAGGQLVDSAAQGVGTAW